MSNTTINYPEMWGASKSEIQATIFQSMYYITTKNEIKVSRGIEYTGTVDLEMPNGKKNARGGWHKYRMTPKAFNKFENEQQVEINILLD